MTLSENAGWFGFAAAPVAVGWVLHLSGVHSVTWLQACTCVMVLFCAFTDARRGRVPNFATYSSAAWGLFINAKPALAAWLVLGGESARFAVGEVGWLSSVLGLVLCFAVMLIGYLLAGSGAGDVKLAAALGALLGWRIALQCLMAAFIIAGAVMIVWLVWTKGPMAILRALRGVLLRLLVPGLAEGQDAEEKKLLAEPVPLGLFIALGTIYVLFVSEGIGL